MSEKIQIHGRGYDFGSITPKLPGGATILGFVAIDYDDSCAVEEQYSNGRTAVAYGQGNYEAKGSIEILLQYVDEFEKGVDPRGDGFYNHDPFPITVSYGNRDMPLRKDELRACKIHSRGPTASKQGDTKITRKYEFKVLGGIVTNGRSAI